MSMLKEAPKELFAAGVLSLHEMNRTRLNDYVEQLFLTREAIESTFGANSVELELHDDVLFTALVQVFHRRGLNPIEAQALGWVDNGMDVWSMFEDGWRAYFESIKITSPEKMNDIPIIGVVGKIASGKGTVAEVLKESNDILSFPFSDRLRAAAGLLGFEPPYTRAELREINDMYKPVFGMPVFVDMTLKRAKRMATTIHPPSLVVVDGFRSVDETDFFLQQPNTHLLAIIADEDPAEDRRIRYARQAKRKRGAEDSLNWERFLIDDEVESDWIEPIIDLTRKKGVIILNDNDLATLTMRVNTTVSRMLI